MSAPSLTAERLEARLLEPMFAEMEPVRQDILVIRGITRSMTEGREVRIRQITPVASIDMHNGGVTEGEAKHYRVDMIRPREKGYLLAGTAVWSPVDSNENLLLNMQHNHLQHFKPGELGNYHTTEELFAAYDRQSKLNLLVNPQPLKGWFNPDIHTIAGMEELATILTEAVDDKKE